MTLDAMEFIRRFLQHVLPRGFQKVRHYGFLSPNSGTSIEAVRWLISLHNGAMFVLLAKRAEEPAAQPVPPDLPGAPPASPPARPRPGPLEARTPWRFHGIDGQGSLREGAWRFRDVHRDLTGCPGGDDRAEITEGAGQPVEIATGPRNLLDGFGPLKGALGVARLAKGASRTTAASDSGRSPGK